MVKNTLYCRFCGQLKAKNEVHEFHTHMKKCQEIIMKLSFVNAANLELNENKILPKTICFNCDELLNNAYEFVKNINTAQEVLKDLFKDCESSYLIMDEIKIEDTFGVGNCDLNIATNIKLESEEKPQIAEIETSFDDEENDESNFNEHMIKEELDSSSEYLDTSELTDDNEQTFSSGKLSQEYDLVASVKEVVAEADLCSWNSYIWICSHCSLQFTSMNDLRDHSKETHKQCLAYSCLDCNTKITSFQMLIKHVRKHRKYLIDNCPYCFKRIPAETETKHIKIHHITNLQMACPTCGEVMDDPQELEDHIFMYGRVVRKRRKVGSPINIDNLNCQRCHKVFKTLYSRRFHERHEHDKDRYCNKQPPKKPTCGHNTKAYQCERLNSNDVLFFHTTFHGSFNKIEQDNFILKHAITTNIQRRRPKDGAKPGKNMSTKYLISKINCKSLIPVCKKAFLGILNLNKSRVDGVLRRHFISGALAVENRGGDRKSFQFRSRREAAMKYIQYT